MNKFTDPTSVVLGVELGSTRIKAVAIDGACRPVAAGEYTWENRLENGFWTYPLEEVWAGLRGAVSGLSGLKPAAMGISGMMHGYLAFDRDWNLLTPFRTWRNTTTGQAADALTGLFGFNIPQRWSVAHLYQAVLNGEPHVKDVAHITTLAGYVHHSLTGVNAVGIGEASGIFPIDSAALNYDAAMLEKFDALEAVRAMPWRLADLLPQVLTAGEPAGNLTEEGAALLGGVIPPGVPLCPPEGDAGTGMTAANAVAPRTGNVSAGTSVFAMVVLERPLSRLYRAIDMVTTPAGAPVAMVHCNTCTSDLDAWVGVFGEALRAAGAQLDKSELYTLLYRKALEGEADCGGLTAFNCYSGEPVLGLDSGAPLLVRGPDARLTLPNLMRAHLCAALAALKLGMDLLTGEEGAALDRLCGHGGLFKVQGVAQRLAAGALDVPVAVMETAGEGGPWGMALLAAYMKNRSDGESLEDYLARRVFPDAPCVSVEPEEADRAGFLRFIGRYQAALELERRAGELFGTGAAGD